MALELERGKLHAVLGPNGAGKTTLINLLSGDLAASSGSIRYKGEDITRQSRGPPLAHRHRPQLPEDQHLPGVHRVRELPARGAVARAARAAPLRRCRRVSAGRAKRRERALEAAGLAGRGERVASALSHGEQRQLEIAMVLATQPEVLLLDEPLAGMGAEEAARMVELLQQLAPRARDPAGRARHGRRVRGRRRDHRDGERPGARKRPAGADPREPRRAQAYLGDATRRTALSDGRSMSEWLLEARELHTYYGASHILHGVDFRIERGETVGLMGRNGMGKTTLIRSMLGLVKPRHGEVRVRGTPMTGAEPYLVARQGIAYVPEGRGIFPNLTVRENLVMAARAGPGRPPRLDLRARARDLSAARRAARPRRLAALRRRAADADDRPRADDQPRSADPRRGDRRARAADRAGRSGASSATSARTASRRVIVDKNYAAVTAITDRNVILVKGRVVFEGDSRDAARAAGHPAQASRRLDRCRSSRSRRTASSTSASTIARAPRADARLPARGAGLGRDVAGFPGPRRACDGLRRPRLFALRLRPVGSARGAARRSRYMHDEALVALPELLDALAIDRPILVGHSDGGSIALIHAGAGIAAGRRASSRWRRTCWSRTSRSRASPRRRTAYETTDLRAKLARYHADVDSAFLGWNRIWLAPEFRAWNIEEYLPRIACPVLAIQGEDDEYGTMEQMRRIGAQVRDVELLALQDCRHSPHRDQPDAVIEAITRFVDRVAS